MTYLELLDEIDKRAERYEVKDKDAFRNDFAGLAIRFADEQLADVAIRSGYQGRGAVVQ